MVQIKEEAKLVPLVEIAGDEYVVDVAMREFRPYGRVQKAIPMHSEKGRQLVRDMRGIQWRTYAVEAANEPFLEV